MREEQFVLRSFATASGDPVRTAKIVGISPDEVRAEISAMLHTNGTSHAEKAVVVPPSAIDKKPRAAAPATESKEALKRTEMSDYDWDDDETDDRHREE